MNIKNKLTTNISGGTVKITEAQFLQSELPAERWIKLYSQGRITKLHLEFSQGTDRRSDFHYWVTCDASPNVLLAGFDLDERR